MNRDYRVSGRGGKAVIVIIAFCLIVPLMVACAIGTTAGQHTFAEAEIESVVLSGAVDARNAPTDVRNEFTRGDAIIYAVFDVKRVDIGTVLYVRWTSDELDFEEQSAPLTADRQYENVFVEFHLEPVQRSTLEGLEPGTYRVQLFINEQEGPSAIFQLTDGG